MKYINYLSLLILAYSLSHASSQLIHKALVIVPVADLLGNPIQQIQRTSHVKRAYCDLPLCGARNNPLLCCPRLHQLLFNEVVEIINQKGDEVHIKIPNLYYVNNTHKTPQHSYWTHKSNLISFKELKSKKVNLKKIPAAISFLKNNYKGLTDIVTLMVPFFDPTTQTTFSAGTRFVVAQKPQESQTEALVYVFDRKKFEFNEMSIPIEYLMVRQPESNQEKIANFVALVKKWAQPKNGFIPYVWGGCSFAATSSSNFTEEIRRLDDTQTSFYVLSGYDFTPKSGLDCSGLVARAAQICGLPYYLKNTTTIASGLRQLKENERLEDGDLLWIPLHVMIISDVKNNKLVEARHYNQGYGRIHELPLNKVFDGINTYDDLIQAHQNRKTIYRTTSEGQIADSISNFKILKLASVWD